RIWRVTYHLAGVGGSPTGSHRSIGDAEESLRSALVAIEGFAIEQHLDGFAKCFRKALDALGVKPVRSGYHSDLAPAGVLSQRAECLLDACQSGWVFGGMGSWNDTSFQDEVGRRYDLVSGTLFHSLGTAIEAAVNAASHTN
ncbi:MAG: hypothetical protein FWD17_01630, partial [Polyangiaceae bacterium]|nr:hypothetical protein [Polyangiaceae bacterium]